MKNVKIIPKGPVIIFGGLHGVGKSTYARIISEKFKLEYVSTGTMFRKLASEKGLSLTELSQLASKDPSIDKIIDEMSKEKILEGNVVFDSLLAPFLAKDVESFKIYLFAPIEVRISRIANRDSKSNEQSWNETIFREKLEIKRFKEYYGFDLNDTSFYNLMLDTSLFDIEGNIKILESAVGVYLERRWKNWL